MATVPGTRTWLVGEKITANRLNTEVRDAIDFILRPPQCIAYRNGALSLATSTTTVVPLNVEEIDTDGMHSTSTNPSRITIVTPGRYEVVAIASFAANSTGIRALQVRFNAAGNPAGGSLFGDNVVNAVPGSGQQTRVFFVASRVFDAADYLELFAYQNSGGDLNLDDGIRQSWMSVRWIGED